MAIISGSKFAKLFLSLCIISAPLQIKHVPLAPNGFEQKEGLPDLWAEGGAEFWTKKEQRTNRLTG